MRPNRQRIIELGARVLFVFSLCLLSLLYGVIAGQYRLFPGPQVRDAASAVNALVEVLGDESDDEISAPVLTSATAPVVRNHLGSDDGAMILVSGGPGYFESEKREGGHLAWLMDRQGRIRHVWKNNPALFAELKSTSTVPGRSYVHPFGVELLEDGGLLVSFQGKYTWPFGIGMARLDKDSNIIWQKENHAHHWFSLTPDGKILTPTHRVLSSPQPLAQTRGRIHHKDGKILEDMVSVLSLDGQVLEEISMLDAVHKSGLIGLYQGADNTTAGLPTASASTNDPLHLNSVEPVGDRAAAAHDWLSADDLLVSFRNTNTIAIVDRRTSDVKWFSAGTTLRQHSPRFMDDGSIVLIDNLGGDKSLGGTRLVKVGLKDRFAQTIFPTRENYPEGQVYTRTVGYLDLNPAGSAALMAVTHQATLFEIDLATGKVLWEYVFVDPATRKPRPLYCAKYCYNVSFPMNQAETEQ